MVTQNPYSNYKDVAINTASNTELTLMLYDGALKFTAQAILALENNELLKFNETIKRSLDIVRELQDTLDSRQDISKDMYELYDYIIRRIVTGNTDKDKDALEEAKNLLREFRDTWKEAMELAKKQ